MYIYFPSCKFTESHPEVSERIKAFLSARGVKIAGCCRLTHGGVSEGDTALTICQSCNIIVKENHPEARVVSVFEFIDSLDDLDLPDLGGEAISLQDCYRAKDHSSEKAAVRSLLDKMNAEVTELPPLPGEPDFDGTFLLSPMSRANLAIAPKSFSAMEKDLTPMDVDAQVRYLKNYCARFETERVVCYCNSCLSGLKAGLPEGRIAVHLAELMFPG